MDFLQDAYETVQNGAEGPMHSSFSASHSNDMLSPLDSAADNPFFYSVPETYQPPVGDITGATSDQYTSLDAMDSLWHSVAPQTENMSYNTAIQMEGMNPDYSTDSGAFSLAPAFEAVLPTSTSQPSLSAPSGRFRTQRYPSRGNIHFQRSNMRGCESIGSEAEWSAVTAGFHHHSPVQQNLQGWSQSPSPPAVGPMRPNYSMRQTAQPYRRPSSIPNSPQLPSSRPRRNSEPVFHQTFDYLSSGDVNAPQSPDLYVPDTHMVAKRPRRSTLSERPVVYGDWLVPGEQDPGLTPDCSRRTSAETNITLADSISNGEIIVDSVSGPSASFEDYSISSYFDDAPAKSSNGPEFSPGTSMPFPTAPMPGRRPSMVSPHGDASVIRQNEFARAAYNRNRHFELEASITNPPGLPFRSRMPSIAEDPRHSQYVPAPGTPNTNAVTHQKVHTRLSSGSLDHWENDPDIVNMNYAVTPPLPALRGRWSRDQHNPGRSPTFRGNRFDRDNVQPVIRTYTAPTLPRRGSSDCARGGPRPTRGNARAKAGAKAAAVAAAAAATTTPVAAPDESGDIAVEGESSQKDSVSSASMEEEDNNANSPEDSDEHMTEAAVAFFRDEEPIWEFIDETGQAHIVKPADEPEEKWFNVDDRWLPRCQHVDPHDLYTPVWIRGGGAVDNEGYCFICKDWFNMKRSKFLYHKQQLHGVSQLTKRPFATPQTLKSGPNPATGKPCTLGYCERCKDWVVAITGLREWREHQKACERGNTYKSRKARKRKSK